MAGFIPFARGSLMLDVVVCALFLVLPVVGFAIYDARVRNNYRRHKKILVGTGALLIVTVILFEIEMRVVGWKHLAEPSPHFDTWVYPTLIVHIISAVVAVVSWSATILGALKNFPSPVPRPTSYSAWHKFLGKIAASSLVATALTGWVFYYVACIAS